MLVYHIVPESVWENFSGELYHADSLTSEGFVHCSFEEQLPAVIQRYYRDAANLVILEIDTSKLTSKLVVEPSTAGEKYPHLYGPINRDAIIAVRK